MAMKQIQVVENVLKLNDEIAAINRQRLRDAGVFCINLIGAPGCGKTALLEATQRQLGNRLRMGVIVGDLATTRDAQRLARTNDHVVQVNTNRGCHLDANQVKQALGKIDLGQIDLLAIENVGNLICPVGFDLGQDAKVGMFSVTEGDDKAAKHPYLVHESSLLILNKTDLLPHVSFNLEAFRKDVQTLNPNARMIELSAAKGPLDEWTRWLEQWAVVRA